MLERVLIDGIMHMRGTQEEIARISWRPAPITYGNLSKVNGVFHSDITSQRRKAPKMRPGRPYLFKLNTELETEGEIAALDGKLLIGIAEQAKRGELARHITFYPVRVRCKAATNTNVELCGELELCGTELELCKATNANINYREKKTRQNFLRYLVLQINKLEDAEWTKLSEEAKTWANALTTAEKDGKPFPELKGEL